MPTGTKRDDKDDDGTADGDAVREITVLLSDTLQLMCKSKTRAVLCGGFVLRWVVAFILTIACLSNMSGLIACLDFHTRFVIL